MLPRYTDRMKHIAKLLRVFAACTISFSATACATSPHPDIIETPPDPTRLPTPYTANQIRAAMPEGTKIWMRMETPKAVTQEEWEVVDADAETVTMSFKVFDEAGKKLLEERPEKTTTWTELRDHASFPIATTMRAEGRIDTPVGSFDSWLYIVDTVGEDGLPLLMHYHFAKELPGPPVLMTKTVDGKTVLTVKMVGRR